MQIKIKAALPKSEQDNGLDAIYEQLCDTQAKGSHLIVAVVEPAQVTYRRDEGDAIPTARVRRLEVIQDPAAREQVLRAFAAAHNERLGGEQLDFDAELAKLTGSS